MEKNSEELILYLKKTKMIVALAGLIFTTILGVLVIIYNGPVICYILGLSPILILFIIPSLFGNSFYLRLTKEGFEVHARNNGYFISWDDIDKFEIFNKDGVKMIVFNYKDGFSKQRILRGISYDLVGWEGAVSNVYNISTEKLCELLNQWKNRYTKTIS